MSEKEILVTREMLGAILNKIALWSLIAVGGALLSGAGWVSYVQIKVNSLEDAEKTAAPIRSALYTEQQKTNLKLGIIIDKIEKIDNKFSNHTEMEGHPVSNEKIRRLQDDINKLNP